MKESKDYRMMDSSAADTREDHLARVDWEASPKEVLEAVDEQLKAFGLEIVRVDTGIGRHAWKIVSRTGKDGTSR